MRHATFLLLLIPMLFAHPVQARDEAPTITVIYDAFGDPGPMRKDWGFAAVIDVGGKRVLFDTGNDAEVFAHNAAAAGINLATVDTVVLSHRHSDHIAGLAHVLAVNPDVTIHGPQEGFGIFGSSLPSTFYRKAPELPARQRYFDGEPSERLQFGTAWPQGNFRPLAETTEIAPGVWAILTTSDAPGTRELRELSLAVSTPEGLLLVVGCSHPGLPVIVAEAAKIDADIHLVIGGFHYVNADDATIAGVIEALAPFDIDFIAPGHCTGEATFAALQAAFGERYVYAGIGVRIVLDTAAGPDRPRGAAAAFPHEERVAYRALSNLSHDHTHTPVAQH